MLLIAAVVLMISATTAGAQPVYPGERAPVSTAEPPFSAVGALKFDDGLCSGTLIDADIVLSAAHCLIREDALEARGVFVTARGRTGGPLSARIDEVRVLPGLERAGIDAQLIGNGDWALVRLDRPLGLEAGVLDVVAAVDNRSRRPDLIGALAMVAVTGLAALATRGRTRMAMAGLCVFGGVILLVLGARAALAPDWRETPVVQAGYGPGEGETLFSGPPCSILRFRPSGLIEHDCAITPGDSGGPLLVRRNEGWAVVAVVSHVQFDASGPRAWATAAAAIPDPRAAFAAARTGSL
ncbi:MAG: trypsin-like serine peptidase [Oceanicaulis sp.]